MTKRRMSLRVADDEVAVVGTIAQWRHLIMVYESLAAEDPANRDPWLEAANWIERWIARGKNGAPNDEW